jgi:hypothetical protein
VALIVLVVALLIGYAIKAADSGSDRHPSHAPSSSLGAVAHPLSANPA